MGFADEIGFRASTAHSFFWYDMSKDSVSSLKIYPFQVMDVSLFKYLNYSIEEAQIEVSQILKWIQSFGGTFSTLWHNSSFYPKEGWTTETQQFYKDLYSKASKM